MTRVVSGVLALVWCLSVSAVSQSPPSQPAPSTNPMAGWMAI
jgi:hypothetical protein